MSYRKPTKQRDRYDLVHRNRVARLKKIVELHAAGEPEIAIVFKLDLEYHQVDKVLSMTKREFARAVEQGMPL